MGTGEEVVEDMVGRERMITDIIIQLNKKTVHKRAVFVGRGASSWNQKMNYLAMIFHYISFKL